MSDFLVQRGSVTLPWEAASTSQTITAGTDYTAPATLSSAFIRITGVHAAPAGNEAGDYGGQPDRNVASITDPENLLTSITFTRYSTSDTITLFYEIIEYIGPAGGIHEFIVRHRENVSVDSTAASVTTSTVSGVEDSANVVVFLTGMSNDANGRGNYGEFLWTTEYLSESNSAEMVRDLTGYDSFVSVAVVEFTGSAWSVQRIEHTPTTTSIETQAITDIGDVTRAFTHHQQRSVADSGGGQEISYEAWLSATNQLSYECWDVGSARTIVSWVVSNSHSGDGAMSVEQISGTRGDGEGGVDPDSWTVPYALAPTDISEVSVMGESSNSDDNHDFHLAFLNFEVTSTTEVTLYRGRDDSIRDYRFEIVKWPYTVEDNGSETAEPEELTSALFLSTPILLSASPVSADNLQMSLATGTSVLTGTYPVDSDPLTLAVSADSATISSTVPAAADSISLPLYLDDFEFTANESYDDVVIYLDENLYYVENPDGIVIVLGDSEGAFADSLSFGLSLESSEITTELSLTVDSIQHTLNLNDTTLSAEYQLNVDAVDYTLQIDNVGLNAKSDAVAEALFQSLSVGAPEIQENGDVSIDSVSIDLSTDTPAVSAESTLDPDAINVDLSIDSTTLSSALDLATNGLSVTLSAESPDLTFEQLLQTDNMILTKTIAEASLTAHAQVLADDMHQALQTGESSISVSYSVNPEDLLLALLTDNPDVVQKTGVDSLNLAMQMSSPATYVDLYVDVDFVSIPFSLASSIQEGSVLGRIAANFGIIPKISMNLVVVPAVDANFEIN